MSETVQIHISIEISTEGDIETGLTVEQWNALSDGERSSISQSAWSTEAADHDSGGMYVVTDGAEGI